MSLAGHVACIRKLWNASKIVVGKPEGKNHVELPSSRWEYNIRMDVKQTGLEGVDWIHLSELKDQWWGLVNMVQ
jgi:hypothetical protein